MIMNKNTLIFLTFAVAIGFLRTGFCQNVQQKVLLSSVNAITLREGKFTTGRRLAPVPQLRCVPGAAPCEFLPTVVQCYNKGSDGFNIQWRCEAQMSKRVMFDTIQVSCEGYDHAADPYILTGSCGLSYSLRPSGRRRHHRNHGIHKSSHLFRRVHVVNPMVSALTGLLAFLVVVAMLALVFKLFRSRRHRYHRVYTAEEGPPAPPPPAYGHHHGGGNGPGFWTGAAVGGMAGYMMGSTASHHFGGHSAPCEVAYESDYVVGDGGSGAFSDDEIGSAVGFGSGWNR